MNIKIRNLGKRIKALEDFINEKAEFDENELLEWISKSTSLFLEIGVNNEIVRGFMKTFEFSPTDRRGIGRIKPDIGPFTYRGENYRMDSGLFSWSSAMPSQDIFYVRVAFTAAKAILRREQDEERLVPKFMINLLSEENKYPHIVSSLELIEQSYSSRDKDGLVKNSLTLLDTILNLENTIKEKSLSKKLVILINDRLIREKFGVDKELIFALDRSRLIRNHKSVHKNKPIEYDIPFLVAVGCAYLIIMLLEYTIATGEFIK